MYHAPHHPVIRLIIEPLSFRKRYGEDPLDGAAAITRLLLMHRAALKAEQRGNQTPADDLWEKLYKTTFELKARQTVWTAITALQAAPRETWELGRDMFIAELLVDTHLAYHNGYSEFAYSATRAQKHLKWAKRYLELLNVPKSSIEAMSKNAEIVRIHEAWKKSDWQGVMAGCEIMLGLSPGDTVYVRLAAQSAANWLSTLAGKQVRLNIQELSNAVIAIERARNSKKHHAPYFDQLGALYHLLAIAQFNSGVIAKALENENRALLFSPHFPAAAQSLSNMRIEKDKIKVQLNAAIAQRRPGMMLTVQAQALKNEVDSAEIAESRFKISNEALNIARDRKLAIGITAWQRMELKPLATDAEAVYTKLASQFDSLSEQRTSLLLVPTLWKNVLEKNPDLSPVTTTILMDYLQKYVLNPQPPHEENIELPPTPNLETAQKITTSSSQRIASERGQLHVGYWLFSRDGRLFRGLVALALLILIVGFGVQRYGQAAQSQRESQLQLLASSRQTAYDALILAYAEGDYADGLDAVELFLENKPLSGTDNRTDQVEALFRQLLVAWIAQDVPSQEAVEERVNHYQSLRGQ